MRLEITSGVRSVNGFLGNNRAWAGRFGASRFHATGAILAALHEAMTVRIDEDDSTRWFDETFASSVKPLREDRAPETFENLLQDVEDRAEHTELLESFGRRRRPAATGTIEVLEDKPED
jgi:hypothetical protein